MRGIEVLLLLVVLAAAAAAWARRLRVPAPSLLVVAGILVASVPGVPAIELQPDVVSLVVLPPLLFAAGQDLPWRELRPVWRPISTLAIGLVVATAAAVAAVASALAGLPPSVGLVLGAVLASTDPVAVTALGRRLALPARLQALIQGESLFNDATSLVLVRVTVAVVVAGGATSWGHGAGEFIWLGGGGALVGAIVAAGVWLIQRRTEDVVLETVVALVTPYAAFVVAEGLDLSGVTAVVVAGVILAGRAARVGRATVRVQIHAVYDTVVFILESVVFSLIGLELPALIRALPGSDWSWIVQAVAITATLLAVRALWIFPLWMVVRHRLVGSASWRVPVVVSWAGARGVLPLTAALSIPLVVDNGAGFPGRGQVLLLTIAVIVLTLVVQGATLGPLVRRSGIAVSAERVRDEERIARAAMAGAALAYLDRCSPDPGTPPAALWQVRDDVRVLLDELDAEHQGGSASARHRLRRDLIVVESAELTRLYEVGEISATTRRELQRRLDLEDSSLDL